jgi:hypothetical protein
VRDQERAVRVVKRELEREGISAVREAELEQEAREIVRFVLALEQHREESRETLSRLRSLERTLERQASAQEVLGDQAALLARYEEISREAGARLAVKLDGSLGSGAIADSIVDARFAELVGE